LSTTMASSSSAMETSIMSPAPTLTTDQYFRTPESLRPTELIFGTLRVAESPTVWHQQAVAAFHLALAPHVRTRRLGYVFLAPLDVVFDARRHLVMQPDLLFIRSGREDIIERKVTGAPDMIMEVLSPNPRIGTLEERVDLFARYGVREIWLLHQTSERFEILSVRDGDVADRQRFDYNTRLTSRLLPAFNAKVVDILAG
jgi:Uma2 family endonuclease